MRRPPGSSLPWGFLALWGAINFQQGAWLTIALPLAVTRMAVAQPLWTLGRLAALAQLVGVVAPPLVGRGWDRLRRTRPPLWFLGAGCAVNLAGLALVASATHAITLGAGLGLLALGLATAGTGVQAWVPELVGPKRYGEMSAAIGVGSLIGNGAGILAAGFLPLHATYALMAALMALSAAVALSRPAPPLPSPAPAPVSRGRFTLLFGARMAVLFGQTLLMTFVLTYFQRVWHTANPARDAARLALWALGAAALAAWWVGRRSDRRSRLALVACSSLPMAAATLAFPAAPAAIWAEALGIGYGVGYGTFLAVDWALALDVTPQPGRFGETLGFWGVAAGLPAVVAPLVGASLVATAGPPAVAYTHLFHWAGGFMLLGSAMVGIAALPWPRWSELGLRRAVAGILGLWVRAHCRVHLWATTPLGRRGVLVIANHTHDLDGMFLPAYLYVHFRLRPLAAVASWRLFEPGFLVQRAPHWLKPWVRPIPLGPILRRLGLHPIEDAPRLRPLRSWAWALHQLEGDLPLKTVFPRLAVPARWAGATLRAAWSGLEDWWAQPVALREVTEPYRTHLLEAARRRWEEDLRQIGQTLAAGVNLYLTPEGHLSRSGRVERFGSFVDRLYPLAQEVWLAAIAYNPASTRRMDLYCRLEPAHGGDIPRQLAAWRPLTPLHWVVVAVFRAAQPVATRAGAWAEARRLLQLGPWWEAHRAWARPPRETFEATLGHCLRRGWVEIARNGGLRVARPWRDRRFPHVEDLFAWLLAQAQETVEARMALGLERPPGPLPR
ncbi:MAG: MFS transporter [Firmicutes bacterium]|nr:MFS transporter [Alicyclobacillaceae bacterium]MCL6498073.1 MFS transporter [Bacillota bacterium]